MRPEQTPPPDTAADSLFDTALGRYYRSEAEPPDDGFVRRVTAALPQRRVLRRGRWVEWFLWAQWAALSLAAMGVAVLMPASNGQADAAHTAAAYALIALLAFWSIPSRWSCGCDLR